MSAAWVLPVAVLAAADWLSVARGDRRAEYFFKPATTAALLAAAYAIGNEGSSGAQLAFTLAALAFSLLGDVFLMLPRDLFVPGLVSFLLAHLCYIGAFVSLGPDLGMSAAAALVLTAVGVPIFGRLKGGLVESGRRALILPVAVYSVVIGAMVATAAGLVGSDEVPTFSALAALVGASFFYVSDLTIGWHRFVRELPWAPVSIMVTYHVGQTGLVMSLLR